MRYDLYLSMEYYIFSVAIEERFFKENCHILNNRFKMETLRHLKARPLYASKKMDIGVL